MVDSGEFATATPRKESRHNSKTAVSQAMGLAAGPAAGFRCSAFVCH
ncbi:MAG: hypothetical protein WAU10_07115 [Caldilineaceae bacterium]